MIYGLSAILSRGLSLITLPIYARILAPADYGALDILMVIGSLANLIIALEINQALARFTHEVSQAERRVLASTAMWFTVAAYGVVLATALYFSEWLCLRFLGNLHYLDAFRLSLCAISANGLFYLCQSQLRFELLSRDYAVVSVAYSVVTVVLGITLGKYFNLGLVGIIAAQLAAAVLGSVMSMSRLPGRYGATADRVWLRTMLAFSLPLVPSGIATFFSLYANRIMLNSLADLQSVGLFGIGARIAGVVGILIVAFQSALTPLIYTHYKEAETPGHLARIAHGFVAIAFTFCLSLGLYATEILDLLVPADYRGASEVVLMLSVATLLSQMSIFFPGIAIAKRTTYQLIIFVITAVAGVSANYLLIPSLGVTGAGIATFLSSMLFIILWIIISQRLYPLPLKKISLSLALVLLAASGFLGIWLEREMVQGVDLILAKAGLLLLFAGSMIFLRLIPVSDLGRVLSALRSRFERSG